MLPAILLVNLLFLTYFLKIMYETFVSFFSLFLYLQQFAKTVCFDLPKFKHLECTNNMDDEKYSILLEMKFSYIVYFFKNYKLYHLKILNLKILKSGSGIIRIKGLNSFTISIISSYF